jgi:hypothetical protein
MASHFAASAQEPPIKFNEQIRPILSENCLACHGLDAKKRQAELRLDDPESALADRGGTFAIKPGDLAASELWNRVTSEDETLVMPPLEAKKTLTAEQKELLRKWIEQGAPYQKPWAFEAPVRPPEPAVKQADWAKNAIDRFILARLEAEGLAPRPEADKETLIRRVAQALTGLPPTIAEIDQYLADTSPEAYENMVDRYLASKAFGEEMARHWLDVARYADTHGLHLDNERLMWAYRDWVVKAFNENLPFDQFTTWQIAGDLLPEPTRDQLIATGFNRCNVTTSEGGAIVDEFLFRYAVDRASTFTETWLGLTGGCAVCHDHKFDPLSAKEFYSLYAFFYSAADPAMDKNIFDTEPFLKLPSKEQEEALAAAKQEEERTRAELEAAAAAATYADPASLAEAPPKRPVRDVLLDDSFRLGDGLRNTSRNPSVWRADPDFKAPSGRRVLEQRNSRFHEEVIQFQLAPVIVPEEARFSVSLRLDPVDAAKAVAVVVNGPGGEKRLIWGDAAAFPERETPLATTVMPASLPAPGEWGQLAFTAADVGLAAGQQMSSIALQEAGGVCWWDLLVVEGQSAPAADPLDSFAAWRKSNKDKSPPDVPGDLAPILKQGPEATVEPAVLDKLLRFYLAHVARPFDENLAQKRAAWQAARAARMAADEAIPGTMIFKELEKPREAFVMTRGQYDKPGEKVEPGVPAVFPPLAVSPGARATRLDLAKWVLAPENPLTARVTANRLWQQFFGVGIVKTSFDFGSQGEPPVNPDLLDWLAVQFRESGWNVKELVKLLVTSAAFRQDSRCTSDLLKRDPENRLLARGPRFRLDAEQIRDGALFASGLLDPTVGGPGVNTYQPPNIWEPVGYSDSNTRYYLQGHGADLYRRSLYTFFKRTAPPPFMSNFDAPNREQFCTRRERSNTPLQALQLMNDVQQFEAARALAERAIAHAASPDGRVEFLYRAVLSRRPDAEETRLVSEMVDRQRTLFEADPAAAEQAIGVGESAPKNVAGPVETAAWTMAANLVLNLDETVNRN